MSIIDTNNYRVLEVRRCRGKKWLVGEMNDSYRYFRPIIRTL